MTEIPPQAQMGQMITGYWTSQAIYAAALSNHVCFSVDFYPEERCCIPPIAGTATFAGGITAHS